MFDIFSLVKKIKKYFLLKDFLIIGVILLLFFSTRLINLDKHPIFSDEGIYIHWAKVAWHDASWRFISLTDGKQPLQTWGTIPFLKLFPDNSLLAGRFFAVLGGLISLLGIFLGLNYLFGKKTAFIGSFLYVLTPYFLFYERLALVDSWVNAGFIWIFFLIILLVKERRLDIALILGFLAGFFLLAKSSVRIFLILGLFAPILIWEKNLFNFIKNKINFLILFSISSIIAVIIYNVQRLSPFLHYVNQKNLTFVMSFEEFLKTPFQYFWNNLKLTPLYILWEMGFIIGLIGLIGLIYLIKNNKKLGFYFLIWIFLPFITIVFFTKILFPRYLIFFASILLILASYYLSNIKNKNFIYILFLFIFISIFYFNYSILFDYKNIPFPPVDRGQYIEGWPAGWGIKEIMDFAREKSKEKPVIILAEGNFGMAADVLDVFLKKDDKITIKGYWPIKKEHLEEHQKFLKDNFVYVFFSHQENLQKNWPIKLIKKIEKPGQKSAFYFFQLIKK